MASGVVGFFRERECGSFSSKRYRNGWKSVVSFLDKLAATPSINQPCEISGEPRSTFLMDFSPDGTKLASTHGDHTVRVTEVSTGKCTHILTGHPRTPWCIAFHPSFNDILASGCLGGEVRIWDLRGGGSEVFHSETRSLISSLTFHPTNQILVFATRNKIYFWDWTEKIPFVHCSTQHDNERVRWVKFDSYGHYLYTGIGNQPCPFVLQNEHEYRYRRDPHRYEANRNGQGAANRYQQDGRRRYQRLVNRFIDYYRHPAREQINPEPERVPSPVHEDGLRMAADYARSTTERFRASMSASVDRYRNSRRGASRSRSAFGQVLLHPRVGAISPPPGRQSDSDFEPEDFYQQTERPNTSQDNTAASQEQNSSETSLGSQEPESSSEIWDNRTDMYVRETSFLARRRPFLSNSRISSAKISSTSGVPRALQTESNGTRMPSTCKRVRFTLEEESRSPQSSGFTAAAQCPESSTVMPHVSTTSDTENPHPHDEESKKRISSSFTHDGVTGNCWSSEQVNVRQDSMLCVDRGAKKDDSFATHIHRPSTSTSASVSSATSSTGLSVHNDTDPFPKRMKQMHFDQTCSETSKGESDMNSLPVSRNSLSSVSVELGNGVCTSSAAAAHSHPTSVISSSDSNCGLISDLFTPSTSRTLELNGVTVVSSNELSQSSSHPRVSAASFYQSPSPEETTATQPVLGNARVVPGRAAGMSNLSVTRQEHSFIPMLYISSSTSQNNDSGSYTAQSVSTSVNATAESVPENARPFPDCSRVEEARNFSATSRDYSDDLRPGFDSSLTDMNFSCKALYNHFMNTINLSNVRGRGPTMSEVRSRISMTPQWRCDFDLRAASFYRCPMCDRTLLPRHPAHRAGNYPSSTVGDSRTGYRLLARNSILHDNSSEHTSDGTSQTESGLGETESQGGSIDRAGVQQQSHDHDSEDGGPSQEYHGQRLSSAIRSEDMELAADQDHQLPGNEDGRGSVQPSNFARRQLTTHELENRARLENRGGLAFSLLSLSGGVSNTRQATQPVNPPHVRCIEPIIAAQNAINRIETNNRIAPGGRITGIQPDLGVLESSTHMELQSERLTSSSQSSEPGPAATSSDPVPAPVPPPQSDSSSLSGFQPTPAVHRPPRIRIQRASSEDRQEGSGESSGVNASSENSSTPLVPYPGLHPDYSHSIMDNSLSQNFWNLHSRINTTLAGVFMSSGDQAVASNIVPGTFRIQRWDFRQFQLPNIFNDKENVVVKQCKIHNNASIDISRDGNLLATFIHLHLGFPDNFVLSVVSLRSETLGMCLFTKSFGPNAISVSLSPSNNHVMVGLASRRIMWHHTSERLIGQIFKMNTVGAGENSMQHVTYLYHHMRQDEPYPVSINSARWLPTIGDGVVYGTNNGELHVIRSGKTKEDSEEEDSRPYMTTAATQAGTGFVRHSAFTQTVPESQNS